MKSGRRPCKHCKPVPIERKRISLPIKQNKPQKAENRNLNGEERKALGRFKRAKEERETAFKRGDLTEAERNTVMALSQPGLAFWASKGYSTFHTRNCSKITGLNQLRGFCAVSGRCASRLFSLPPLQTQSQAGCKILNSYHQ